MIEETSDAPDKSAPRNSLAWAGKQRPKGATAAAAGWLHDFPTPPSSARPHSTLSTAKWISGSTSAPTRLGIPSDLSGKVGTTFTVDGRSSGVQSVQSRLDLAARSGRRRPISGDLRIPAGTSPAEASQEEAGISPLPPSSSAVPSVTPHLDLAARSDSGDDPASHSATWWTPAKDVYQDLTGMLRREKEAARKAKSKRTKVGTWDSFERMLRGEGEEEPEPASPDPDPLPIPKDTKRDRHYFRRGSTGSVESLDSYHPPPEDSYERPTRKKIRQGGAAAAKVWHTPELRLGVLSLLRKDMLAVCLRLEKGVTSDVAGLLYKEIHVGMMSRMSRAAGRRVIYCDAVRVLHLSKPLPEIVHRRTAEAKKQRRPAVHFDPVTLLPQISKFRKKFPNLCVLHHHYPATRGSDTYSVDLRDGRIRVDLETGFQLEFFDTPFRVPDFPPIPSFDGVEIVRHTLALTIGPSPLGEKGGHNLFFHPFIAVLAEWKQFLYCNSTLDRRITNIDSFPCRSLTLSLAEMSSFIEQRRSCEPLSHLCLDSRDDMSLRDFRTLIRSLPPTLRSLHIDVPLLEDLDTNPTAIAIIDEALPQLEELAIQYGLDPNPRRQGCLRFHMVDPLVGLPKLKKFTLLWYGISENEMDSPARYICELGSEDCVYSASSLHYIKPMQEFNDRARELKLMSRMSCGDLEHMSGSWMFRESDF